MNARRRLAALAALATVAAAATLGGEGCETSTPPPPTPAPDAGTSPNASILPAPLAEPPELLDAGGDASREGIAADPAGRLLVPDASVPPPEPFQVGEVLAPELVGAKDLAGVTIDGSWRWRDVPAPLKAPEVSAEGLRDAVKATSLTWRADLSEGGRMRVEITSHAQALPKGSEIRARADRWGHIVLWPNSTNYRIVPPGALRTVIGERRVDAMPATLGAVHLQGEGRRLGVATRKAELTSSLGSVKLELGRVPEAGEGGVLFCRALVEIAGVDPKSPVCQLGEVPLSVAYTWQEGGGISFEVTSITRRTDLPPAELVVPPAGAQPKSDGLPTAPGGIFLTREQLAAFRTAPIASTDAPRPAAPPEGFIAANYADMLMYLLVDGVPVVAVPPGGDRYVIGAQRGRYVVAWRTFLGDRTTPAQTLEVPARFVYGQVGDAGAPDGG